MSIGVRRVGCRGMRAVVRPALWLNEQVVFRQVGEGLPLPLVPEYRVRVAHRLELLLRGWVLVNVRVVLLAKLKGLAG